MKFFGWMQNKLHGKQGNTHRPSISSYVSPYIPREEFSDWPHGLFAIGTFGSVNNKEETPQKVEQEETTTNMRLDSQVQIRDQDLSDSSNDLQDFTPEEVMELLTKLLNKRKSDLLLDRFLNCPSSLQVDRRISNSLSDEKEDNITRTISVILGRCKAISTESKNKKRKSKKDLSRTSISYLLKKMFVFTEGFSHRPNPSLKDKFQESRMEKFLRMMLHKKSNTQALSTSTKKYLQNKQHLSLEEEGRSSKWVKTDSDFIVLEI